MSHSKIVGDNANNTSSKIPHTIGRSVLSIANDDATEESSLCRRFSTFTSINWYVAGSASTKSHEVVEIELAFRVFQQVLARQEYSRIFWIREGRHHIDCKYVVTFSFTPEVGRSSRTKEGGAGTFEDCSASSFNKRISVRVVRCTPQM